LIFFLYELFLGTVAFLFTNVYANLGDRNVSPSFVRAYGRFSLLFPPLVALMSLPFFLILPRTQTPIFDLFGRGEQGLVSGIAREVELGKVGEIQQDNSVVMRIYGKLPERGIRKLHGSPRTYLRYFPASTRLPSQNPATHRYKEGWRSEVQGRILQAEQACFQACKV